MADTPAQDDALAPTDEEALRQRLLGRIAVAAVVIVGLLGSLAVFDALYAPAPPKAPAKIATVKPATEPFPAPIDPAVSKPTETPVAPAPDSAKPEANTAEPGKTDTAKADPGKPDTTKSDTGKSVPVKETTVASAPLPLAPLPAERLTKPASSQQALAHPGSSLPPKVVAPAMEGSALPTRPTPNPELVREASKAATAAQVTRSAPASKPLTQVIGAAPASASGAEMGRGFALQLGVFTNFANAEELRSKLESAGIPATVEARVRAGPFASRAEVDAARAKLRALGISESILIAVRH